MNIVFASDDNFIPQLLVSMNSLLYHNNIPINIYILDNNISEKNKNRIKCLVSQYNQKLKFIKFSDKINLEYYVKDKVNQLSLTTYYRLFLASILPDIDKILYLDCDSLIVDDISDLWNIDLENYLCAGVLDLMPNVYKENIGLSKDDVYINAGVLLINLKSWRKENIEEKFINFIKINSNKPMHHDQGVINAILKDRIKVIPPKFNWLNPFHGTNPFMIINWFLDSSKYYDKDTIINSEDNPVFLHFCACSMGRPWNNKNHFYYDLYKRYVHLAKVDGNEIYVNKEDMRFLSRLFGSMSRNKVCSIILENVPNVFARNITNSILKFRMKI